MSYSRIQTIGRYEGVSTDTKPTDSTVKEGSQLQELDTGKKFKFKDGNWAEDTSGPINNNTFNTAQSALRRLAEGASLNSDITVESDGHYDFIENR